MIIQPFFIASENKQASIADYLVLLELRMLRLKLKRHGEFFFGSFSISKCIKGAAVDLAATALSLQLKSSRQFQRRDLCDLTLERLFGVPQIVIGLHM